MTAFQVLSLLGVGSIFSAIAVGFWRYMRKVFLKNTRNIEALMKGVQAVLRAQMIRDYNYYKEKSYAPIYAKDNFQNCWEQYEALGANGVMCRIHEEFMGLPTSLEDDK